MTAKENLESKTLNNGSKMKLLDLTLEDKVVHDWYRFVLSYPPSLVRDYVEQFALSKNHLVLDPFCGTGTTLVECKKLGIPSIGFDANPMVSFASQVKTTWNINSPGFLDHARRIAKQAKADIQKEGIHDDPESDSNPSLESTSIMPKDRLKLLLANSISPLPLKKCLTLFKRLQAQEESPFYQHELLALAKTIVNSSNLRFGPEVGLGHIKKDYAVISAWLAQVETMSKDISSVQEKSKVTSKVYRMDSRSILDVIPSHSVDAVITSPPYPNEKDYTRTTRLESVILNFINSKEELRKLKYELIRSNTRNVYKADTDDQWVSNHLEIQRIAEKIEKRRIELRKTSGFERLYGRVTKLYFGGMARHLADMRRILRPGAKLAYVVGDQASYLQVMIRTGNILADIAQSLGYDLIDIDLFRTRYATATKENLREEVIILRWTGDRTPKTAIPEEIVEAKLRSG